MDTPIGLRAARIPRDAVFRHGAAKIVYAADKLLEGIDVDFARLLEEAKEPETYMQTLREQAKAVTQQAGFAVSVTSPDSREFRVERREVMLFA